MLLCRWKDIDFEEDGDDVMEIKEISEVENKEYWIKQIKESDWSAGKYLYSLLRDDSFYTLCGKNSKVFLLTDGNKLMSFCSLAEIDDIPDTDMTPWIGFVYTFPAFRGKRLIGKLIEHACLAAKQAGHKNVYVSTEQKGLYENFGFTFYKKMKDRRNEVSLVYKIEMRDEFGDEKLCYENNPEQFREVHWKNEEKHQRYNYLKAELLKKLETM